MKRNLQANVFSVMLIRLVVILKEAHYKPQMYWKMIFPPKDRGIVSRGI